jgi:hypothetical protein
MNDYSEKSNTKKSINNNKTIAIAVIAIIALGALSFVIPAAAGITGRVAHAAIPATKSSVQDTAQIGPRAAVPSKNIISGDGKVGMAPGCGTGPCPMGIVDFGVTPSGVTYSYKATIAEGFVDISVLGIGTANGGGCLDPDAEAGVCFTIQSNWITQNFPTGNDLSGQYWTQNVPEVAYDASCSSPCVSGTYSVTWLDNIWNFSNSHLGCTSGCMQGLTGNLAGLCSSYGGGTFYYCVGPTVYDLLPPFTIWTWTDVGPGSGGYGYCKSSTTVSCVNFYGAIIVDGSFVFGTYYDGVSFSHAYTTNKPTYLISGSGCPGYCLPYDGELVAGGPGGGSGNSVYLSGTWQELHGMKACETCFSNIKHAWSSGADTAEYIYDLYMWPYSYLRAGTAISAFGTDNPQVSLW